MRTTTIAGDRPYVATRRRTGWKRRWLFALPFVVVFAAAVAIAAHLLDEPLRSRLETTLNQRMKGYTVRLPRLDFHPLGFSLTLHELSVRQNAHPEPPVIVIKALHAGVHWRALLHLRLVADFEFQSPRVHINRPQLLQEADDKVPVKDKGWQDALEAIYPLKINHFQINDGELTYIDDDTKHPLQISRMQFVATNIRNVKSPDETYPSPIRLDATVFDRGRLHVDGDANFLAEPYAGVRADVDLHDIPLSKLKPVAVHANVQISGGKIAEFLARIEYSPKVQDVHIRRAVLSDIKADYVHTPQTEVAEAQRMETVKTTTAELTKQPATALTIDEFSVRNAIFGYEDETRTPHYRVFLSDASIDLRKFTNQPQKEPSYLGLMGNFMGSGWTRVGASFMPRQNDPQLDVDVEIDPTDMRTMNDLLRAYGNFDVVGGRFSFYSQVRIKDGTIEGYVKPLFENMQVYDRRQDSEKPVLHQIYEGVVGGLSKLLENRHEAVATQATLRGEATSPETSTWEVVVNLLRNALFNAIVPGFENALRKAQPQQGS